MTTTRTAPSQNRASITRTENLILLTIALIIAALHIATNSRYGFHRDELQFLWDAHHLDWGFVAYPPITPFLEHLSLGIFGLSLVGLRLFSVIAQSTAIVISGLMARELGGNRLAQVAVAISVALSPLPLFEGTEFQYSSFDYLWWTLAAYFLIRLLQSENPRWWLAVGAALGLGLQTKYTIVFFITGILGGMLLSSARRYFLSKWFWAGLSLALLIFLPNFLWQAQHHFVSYQFLHHIHVRDVGQGRADGFVGGQFWICVNLIAAPLWLFGLYSTLGGKLAPRYRLIGWMYIIPFLLFFFARGRSYYLAAAYPMLLAAGSVSAESWLRGLSSTRRHTIAITYFTAVIVCGAVVCAHVVPIASSGPLRTFALANNGDLREEIGWPELVQTVASIRDSLPANQQASLGIVADNYGEAGAIEILGPTYRLPPPISTVNSGWLRGYPTPAPNTYIVLGMSLNHGNEIFNNCHVAGHTSNSLAVKNEESEDHPDILLCGLPRIPWPELWKHNQNFG
jgi:hypothetical protein